MSRQQVVTPIAYQAAGGNFILSVNGIPETTRERYVVLLIEDSQGTTFYLPIPAADAEAMGDTLASAGHRALYDPADELNDIELELMLSLPEKPAPDSE